MIKTIRYMDVPNIVLACEVYDSSDTLLSSTIMAETGIVGVYRHDIDVSALVGDVWVLIRDSQGAVREMVKIAPSIDSLKVDIDFLRAIEGGRWQIVGQQMVFFAENNTTEVARFDFKDDAGLLTNPETAFERTRV